MNNKKTYADVLKERGQDLKTLIVYFSVTRVMRCEKYADKIGGFSYKKFTDQKGFLTSWKKQSEYYKKTHARDFVIYQKTYNETLGIPRDLIQDILGKYEPTRKWIPFRDALDTIGGEVVWRVVGHGHRVHTDKEKNIREIKESFCRKIYPESVRKWREMLHDSTYSRLEKIPNASERAIRIIKAWEMSRALIGLVTSGKVSIDQIQKRLLEKEFDKKLVSKVVTMINRETKDRGNIQ